MECCSLRLGGGQDGIGSRGFIWVSPVGSEFELDLKACDLRQTGQLRKLERIPTEVLKFWCY